MQIRGIHVIRYTTVSNFNDVPIQRDSILATKFVQCLSRSHTQSQAEAPPESHATKSEDESSQSNLASDIDLDPGTQTGR